MDYLIGADMSSHRVASKDQRPKNQFHAQLLSQIGCSGKERLYAERMVGSAPLDTELPPIEFSLEEDDRGER
jgi:hypothetical protein